MSNNKLIEARARLYAMRPTLLDNIEPGLSKLSSRRLASRIAELLAAPHSFAQRGVNPNEALVNLHAAARYAARLAAIGDHAAHHEAMDAAQRR